MPIKKKALFLEGKTLVYDNGYFTYNGSFFKI